MAGKSTMDRLARGNPAVTILAAQTTSAVQGTATNHAHGLTDGAGNALTPIAAMAVCTATDEDHASTGLFTTPISIVSMDATNVRVRAGTASQTFTLLVW